MDPGTNYKKNHLPTSVNNGILITVAVTMVTGEKSTSKYYVGLGGVLHVREGVWGHN